MFGVLNTIALSSFFQKIRVQYSLEVACTPYTFRKSRYIAILKFSCLLYVGSAHSLVAMTRLTLRKVCRFLHVLVLP